MSPDAVTSFDAAARVVGDHRDHLGARVIVLAAALHDMPDTFTFGDVVADVEHRRELLRVVDEIDEVECGLVAVGWHWLKADRLMPSIPAQALFP